MFHLMTYYYFACLWVGSRPGAFPYDASHSEVSACYIDLDKFRGGFSTVIAGTDPPMGPQSKNLSKMHEIEKICHRI